MGASASQPPFCQEGRVLTYLEAGGSGYTGAKDPRFAVIGFKCGEVVHEAGGCERCGGTGYRGRNGVFEILEMSDEVRTLIGPQTDSHSIDAAAMRGGMTTMLEDAVAKCRAGMTTVPEVFRVTTVR